MSHKYGTCLLIVVRLQHSHDQLLDVFELVGRVLTEREGEREGGGTHTEQNKQTVTMHYQTTRHNTVVIVSGNVSLSNNTTQHCCDRVRKCLT